MFSFPLAILYLKELPLKMEVLISEEIAAQQPTLLDGGEVARKGRSKVIWRKQAQDLNSKCRTVTRCALLSPSSSSHRARYEGWTEGSSFTMFLRFPSMRKWFYSFFLKTDLLLLLLFISWDNVSVYPWLAWNLLYRPSWLWTQRGTPSTCFFFQNSGLKLSTTTPSIIF